MPYYIQLINSILNYIIYHNMHDIGMQVCGGGQLSARRPEMPADLQTDRTMVRIRAITAGKAWIKNIFLSTVRAP